MNFYKHHIGDYAQATAHLSFVEDAAYTRCLRKYYAEEAPLPVDPKAVQRLVGARTKEEREAVILVLEEFFELREDGWHNKRADRELSILAEAEPDREAKKANMKERQRRTRERRKVLFDLLREHGVVPAYDAPMAELQALASRFQSPATSPPVTAPVTRDATANQTPDTTSQTPDIEQPPPRTAPCTDAGRVCLALKRTGLSGLNPGHPDLLALIAAGATEAEFVGAAHTAVDRGKGFAYAIGMLKRQREDAAKASKSMHTGPLPGAPPLRQSATDRQIATMNALTGKDRDHDRQRAPAADTIDIAARVVP